MVDAICFSNGLFPAFQATSPQTGGKSMKDSKSSQQEKEKEKDKDKDVQEGSGLKTAGPDGEITAGLAK